MVLLHPQRCPRIHYANHHAFLHRPLGWSGKFIRLVFILREWRANKIQLESDIPYLILFNNTGSPGLSIFLNVVLFLLIYAGNITALATCAREVFAFARDKGLPFSKMVGRMDPKWNIPFNAVYITSVGVVLLSLINLGSTLAVRHPT